MALLWPSGRDDRRQETAAVVLLAAEDLAALLAVTAAQRGGPGADGGVQEIPSLLVGSSARRSATAGPLSTTDRTPPHPRRLHPV
jgi:hypothetical protein